MMTTKKISFWLDGYKERQVIDAEVVWNPSDEEYEGSRRNGIPTLANVDDDLFVRIPGQLAQNGYSDVRIVD